jgi:hypothetical protein|tara:strand:+ start:682 stop:810 length:129 start_codon:yes stop_codon:yes gene_type:complete
MAINPTKLRIPRIAIAGESKTEPLQDEGKNYQHANQPPAGPP